ncbi:MAG: hypothetical protein EKK57_05050 [Proteobacteria bacterium]|nr:MAG: hypothetical protein EKK57_05050 [Pseudomonadota bacterium]
MNTSNKKLPYLGHIDSFEFYTKEALEVSGGELGNKAYYSKDGIRYMDNDELVKNNPRPCVKCNRFRNSDDTDPCLGKLPGVKAACCGHGVCDGYIFFENGTIIRFGSVKETQITTYFNKHE